MITSRFHWTMIVTLIGFSLMSGCNFEETRPGAQQVGQADLGATPSTHEMLMTQLFGPHCAGCHNHGRSSGGINLTSIDLVLSSASSSGQMLIKPNDPDGSFVLQIIRSGEMPPQKSISPDLIAMLACWIQSGATREDSSCATDVGPSPNLIIVVESNTAADSEVEKP